MAGETGRLSPDACGLVSGLAAAWTLAAQMLSHQHFDYNVLNHPWMVYLIQTWRRETAVDNKPDQFHIVQLLLWIIDCPHYVVVMRAGTDCAQYLACNPLDIGLMYPSSNVDNTIHIELLVTGTSLLGHESACFYYCRENESSDALASTN